MAAAKNPPIRMELSLSMDDNTAAFLHRILDTLFESRITEEEAAQQVAEVVAQPVTPTATPEPAPMVPPVIAQPPVAPTSPAVDFGAYLTPPAPIPVVPQVAPPIIPQAPVVPVPAPVAAPPVVPVAPPIVPTVAASTLTLETLTQAGAEAVGRGINVMGLMSEFGIIMMTQLPTERYEEFALRLRALGGNI